MSEVLEYLTFTKSEKTLLLKLVIIFPILYTLFATHISLYSWQVLYLPILIWYMILQIGQLLFHKYCAYYQDFKLEFEELEFNRFHLESHSTLTKRHIPHHGIKYSIISTIISILTVGFLVIPQIYTYNHKKIDHLFDGKRKMFESPQGNLWAQENTQIRQAYALFFANLFPIMLIIILTAFKNSSLFQLLIFLTIIFSITQLLPLIPLIGFKYFSMNVILWIASSSILITFSLFSLIFTSFLTFIVVSMSTIILILLVQFVHYTAR